MKLQKWSRTDERMFQQFIAGLRRERETPDYWRAWNEGYDKGLKIGLAAKGTPMERHFQ